MLHVLHVAALLSFSRRQCRDAFAASSSSFTYYSVLPCSIFNVITHILLRKIHTEYCFNVEVTTALSSEETRKLLWLFAETYEPEHTGTASYLHIRAGQENTETIIEVGPRLAFSTAWSSNCVSMCHSCGILGVTRIERSRRYKLIASEPLTDSIVNAFIGMVHDRMTECVYPSHLTTFTSTVTPEPVTVIPIMEQGKTALETLNRTKVLLSTV